MILLSIKTMSQVSLKKSLCYLLVNIWEKNTTLPIFKHEKMLFIFGKLKIITLKHIYPSGWLGLRRQDDVIHLGSKRSMS